MRRISLLLFLGICVVGGLWLGEMLAPKPLVVWVPIEGYLDDETAKIVQEQLETLRQDRRVAGIVLAIDSAGGSAVGGEQIYYSVLRLRQDKPVAAAIQSQGLSSAYMIAVATAPLYSTSASHIGSVGTRVNRPSDISFLTNEIYTGPYKPSGGSRFDLIRQLDLIKENFAAIVQFQRQQAEKPLQIDIAALTEAKTYTGSEGLALGLVDRIGGLADAASSVAAQAGVRSYVLVRYDAYRLTTLPWWRRPERSDLERFTADMRGLPAPLPTSTVPD